MSKKLVNIHSKHIISAYLLGILSILLVLLPLWYLSKRTSSVGNFVSDIWCHNIESTHI